MTARIVSIRSLRPDPKPTGAVVAFDPMVAGRIRTVGENVVAIGRGLGGNQTTDTAVATAKARLRAYIAELTLIERGLP